MGAVPAWAGTVLILPPGQTEERDRSHVTNADVLLYQGANGTQVGFGIHGEYGSSDDLLRASLDYGTLGTAQLGKIEVTGGVKRSNQDATPGWHRVEVGASGRLTPVIGTVGPIATHEYRDLEQRIKSKLAVLPYHRELNQNLEGLKILELGSEYNRRIGPVILGVKGEVYPLVGLSDPKSERKQDGIGAGGELGVSAAYVIDGQYGSELARVKLEAVTTGRAYKVISGGETQDVRAGDVILKIGVEKAL